MSGLLEEFRDEEDNLKNYQQAVNEIDQILTDRNNWDAGKIFVSGVSVTAREMESLPFASPFVEYNESDILEPMRNGDKNFVFSRLLYRPSDPDGWEHLYRAIQRAGYNAGMQLNCYGFNKNKRYNIKCFRGKIFKAKKESKYMDGTCFIEEAEGLSIRRVKKQKVAPRKKHSVHNSTTKAVQKDYLCPFQFTVLVHPKYDIFYVKGKFGCHSHKYHPCLSKGEVSVCSRAASNKDNEINTLLSKGHCPPSIARRILTTKNGFTFAANYFNGNMHDNIGDNTVCDDLINFFRGNKEIKSVCLFDDLCRDEFVTINKSRKQNKKFKLTTLCNGVNGEEEMIDLDESTCDRSFLTELELLRAKMKCSNTGRMLLAIAWTSLNESKKFASHPHVCSWDVTEGTNNEKRKLFIGLNYDATGSSNRHTHIFLPSGRKWVFNWTARTAVPMLHGTAVCAKIQIHLFDEDTNEFGPFENATDIYPNAKIRLCWYHRHTQKLQRLYRFATGENEEKVSKILHGFDELCTCLADYCESDMETTIIRSLAQKWIHDSRTNTTIDETLGTELSKHLYAIESNLSRISYHQFMRQKLNLTKKTTSANECSHKNYKYGPERIQPKFNMAKTAENILMKSNSTIVKKKKGYAVQVMSTHLWCNIKIRASRYALRLFKKEYDARNSYHWCRISKYIWYVMRKEETMNVDKTRVKPVFKRVRIIEYKDGYYQCSYCSFLSRGFACRHDVAIGVPIGDSCFHVKYWCDYNYNMDEKYSTGLKNSYAVLENVMGVMMPPPPDALEYPTFSEGITSLEEFTNVIDSPWPIVLNWDPQHVKDSMLMSGHTIIEGMSQDVIDFTDQVSDVNEYQNIQISKHCAVESNNFQHWTSYVKDLCKYEKACNDRNFSHYVDIMLQKILTDAIGFEKGEFNVTKEISEKNLIPDEEDAMNNMSLSQNVIQFHTANPQVTYISPFPAMDTRNRDSRIKSSFER